MSLRLALTGVSRGIGEAVGQLAMTESWILHAFGRGPKPEWIREGSFYYPCDMSDLDAVTNAAASVYAPIDVLICNAGTFGGDAFHLADFSSAAFAEAFVVNTIAPTRLATSLLPHLQQGQHKLVVMMSTGNASLAGNNESGMLAYKASKSALNQVTRSIAAEWGPMGITTVALNPGWVRTQMGGEHAPLSTAQAASDIAAFITERITPDMNGRFVNTDGSELPW